MMSTTLLIIVIFAALAFIASNIITLQKSKRFDLPDSYKARKAAEAAHLAKNNEKNPSQSHAKSTGYENDYEKEDEQEKW